MLNAALMTFGSVFYVVQNFRKIYAREFNDIKLGISNTMLKQIHS